GNLSATRKATAKSGSRPREKLQKGIATTIATRNSRNGRTSRMQDGREKSRICRNCKGKGAACCALTPTRATRLAKKKSHEDEIRSGLAALRNLGIAVDAPAPDLVPQLKTQFGRGRETDLAAIFSLGKIFDPAAVEALGEIDRQTTDKDLKKEIKRSRFKLAQKGLVAPQEKAADT